MKARSIIKKVTFNEPIKDNRFENLYAAERWLKDNGYSVGQMCHPRPMAIMVGEWDWIAKWKNLTKTEISQIDGFMVSVGDNGYEINIYNLSNQLTA